MDTIIVMGSANIRHNNENEKRFFFLLCIFVHETKRFTGLSKPRTVFKIEHKKVHT